MNQVLENGPELTRALEQGGTSFSILARQLGYSPFEAHDLVRVYRALVRVAEYENQPLGAFEAQLCRLTFPKLSLIATVIEKDPSTGAYWLDMAENLPLQDLRGPIQQALQELKKLASSG